MTRPPAPFDLTVLHPTNVPSFAEELPGRVVRLSHPSNNLDHTSLTAAVSRYRGKGWHVAVVPHPTLRPALRVGARAA